MSSLDCDSRKQQPSKFSADSGEAKSRESCFLRKISQLKSMETLQSDNRVSRELRTVIGSFQRVFHSFNEVDTLLAEKLERQAKVAEDLKKLVEEATENSLDHESEIIDITQTDSESF